MRRATSTLEANQWVDDEVLSTITLSFDDRFKRRIKMTDDDGTDFLLDLADAVQLKEGHALILEDGGIIVVRAAAEEVLDIQCKNLAQTARIAWYIGNRHTPVQVLNDGGLRITYDHVLQHMIEGLGAKATRKQATFSPEPGAYEKSEHTGGNGHNH
jgi:urease accessory protein